MEDELRRVYLDEDRYAIMLDDYTLGVVTLNGSEMLPVLWPEEDSGFDIETLRKVIALMEARTIQRCSHADRRQG